MRSVLEKLQEAGLELSRAQPLKAWAADPQGSLSQRKQPQMSKAFASILGTLRESGGLQGRDIANIVSVSPATVSRWLNGKANPELRHQTIMAELRYVVDRLAEYYSPEETRLWLHAKHPLLGNERAIDLINDGRIEEVLAVIEMLDAAAFT